MTDQLRRPQVLLAELTECISGKGNRYLRGWAGASNLVGFQGKPDVEGRPTWKLYLVERQPKPEPRQDERPARELVAAADGNEREGPAR